MRGSQVYLRASHPLVASSNQCLYCKLYFVWPNADVNGLPVKLIKFLWPSRHFLNRTCILKELYALERVGYVGNSNREWQCGCYRCFEVEKPSGEPPSPKAVRNASQMPWILQTFLRMPCNLFGKLTCNDGKSCTIRLTSWALLWIFALTSLSEACLPQFLDHTTQETIERQLISSVACESWRSFS